jgi:hypothetical protein
VADGQSSTSTRALLLRHSIAAGIYGSGGVRGNLGVGVNSNWTFVIPENEALETFETSRDIITPHRGAATMVSSIGAWAGRNCKTLRAAWVACTGRASSSCFQWADGRARRRTK